MDGHKKHKKHKAVALKWMATKGTEDTKWGMVNG